MGLEDQVGVEDQMGVEECEMIVDRHNKSVETQVDQTVEDNENSGRKSNSMSNALARLDP